MDYIQASGSSLYGSSTQASAGVDSPVATSCSLSSGCGADLIEADYLSASLSNPNSTPVKPASYYAGAQPHAYSAYNAGESIVKRQLENVIDIGKIDHFLCVAGQNGHSFYHNPFHLASAGLSLPAGWLNSCSEAKSGFSNGAWPHASLSHFSQSSFYGVASAPTVTSATAKDILSENSNQITVITHANAEAAKSSSSVNDPHGVFAGSTNPFLSGYNPYGTPADYGSFAFHPSVLARSLHCNNRAKAKARNNAGMHT